MKIDITRHLGATQREVALRDHEGTPAQVVTVRRRFDTEIDDVWDAITDPTRIVRWLLPVSGELRLGGRYQLEGNAGGEITRCEPPRHLAVTWEYGDQLSWVRATLTEIEPGTTELRVEHLSHTPEDFWERYGPGATGLGWELMLMGLSEHLGGAPAVDHAAAEQWPATEDGRRFVAVSGRGWADASIAAGTPANAAQGAADRTVAFYTGAPEPDAPT
ncbi:MAG: SRPBCC family protein [Nannocystaceae bacterium]